MVAGAAEILRRGLPVGVQYPPVGSDHLRAPFPAVQQGIQVPGHIAQVLQERRGFGVEGRENQPFVGVQLSHRNQPPGLTVEAAIMFRHRQTDQLSLVAEAPAVVRAREEPGIPPVQTADPIPPVATQVEKGAEPTVRVPAEDHRVLPHVGADEIAGVGDLTLMTEIEPAPGEDALLLELVNPVVGEHPPVHESVFEVNEPLDAPDSAMHRWPPFQWLLKRT